MRRMEQLGEEVQRIDGRGYRAYKNIAGSYAANDFELHIEHVQGDPFAEPSRISVTVPSDVANFPDFAIVTETARRATADFLNRLFCQAIDQHSCQSGSGKSGMIEMLRPGQQVLARSSLSIDPRGEVRARFRVGLPAHGRRVAAKAARNLLTQAVPACVRESLVAGSWDGAALLAHVQSVEDSVVLRESLHERGFIAFVADGARLPRLSGSSDLPSESSVVPFSSPDSLRVKLPSAHSGDISGLGIPVGVTLIVGGGYHGKSTLLRAVERGYLDHIPGDGRERVVSVFDTVKIRAEDGRAVSGADISAFISNLPGGENTENFSTPNASGSTSQAAAISEALELGASALILDEDTCATNFMIRDQRMQRLVATADEPITPFLDRVRGLFEKDGVSTLLVMGGCGDYFDVADTVILMRRYVPEDASLRAREISLELISSRNLSQPHVSPPKPRFPNFGSLRSCGGPKGIKVRVRDIDLMSFGDEDVRLGCVEQLVEKAQVRAIGQALLILSQDDSFSDKTLCNAVEELNGRLKERGFGALTNRITGDLALFRKYELAAVLGRVRALRMKRN